MDDRIFKSIEPAPVLVHNLCQLKVGDIVTIGTKSDIWSGLKGVTPEYNDFLYVDYYSEHGWSVIKPTYWMTGFRSPGKHVRVQEFMVLATSSEKNEFLTAVDYFDLNSAPLFAYKWWLYFGYRDNAQSAICTRLKNIIIQNRADNVAKMWLNNIGNDFELSTMVSEMAGV